MLIGADSLGAVDCGLGVVGVLQDEWECWCRWPAWTTVEGRGGGFEASWEFELLALWTDILVMGVPVEALEGARGRWVEEREPLRSRAWA